MTNLAVVALDRTDPLSLASANRDVLGGSLSVALARPGIGFIPCLAQSSLLSVCPVADSGIWPTETVHSLHSLERAMSEGNHWQYLSSPLF